MSGANKGRKAQKQREVEPQQEVIIPESGGDHPRTAVKSDSARWREIVRLGELLISTSRDGARWGDSILSQRDRIEEAARHLLSGDAALWLAPGLLPEKTSPPDGDALFPLEPPSELMRCAYQTGRLCCEAGGHAVEAERCDGEAALTALAAPLTTSDGSTALGALQVERPDGPEFTPVEVELVESLAAEVAIALQAGRQMATERWRVEQLSLVRRVSAQIADLRDLDELSSQVAQLILDTFDFYYVAIFTLEPGQDVLHFRSSAGPARPDGAPAHARPPALAIHFGEGIVGHVAESGQEIAAGDVTQEARYRYSDALPETRSEVALPLKIEDRVLGVLDVQSNQPDDFQETDLIVLRALAGNIAIAVEGARLYTALRRRAEQLSTLFEVSNAITSILDEQELLTAVVSLIHNRFGYPYVHLFSVHPGRRKILYEAGSGARSQTFKEQNYFYDLDDLQGIIPWVARHGETVLANDVDAEPRYRPSPLPPEETRAELTVPLIFGGNVLGVLDIQSDRKHAFSDDDRFLFEALADNIAIAMRNASLYRSEVWRRQVADSLREVAGLLSAAADLDQVLDVILTELERSLPCDLAAIWLLDEAIEDDRAIEDDEEASENGDFEGSWEAELSSLRLAAVHGGETVGLYLENGANLGEVMGISSGEDAIEEAARPSLWLAESLNSDQPVIRSPESPLDPLGAILGFPANYSAIAAPLRVGSTRMGILTLADQTSGRYGSESRLMTAAFAGYAAVAIENTRLYEAAHEQAWVSTVLLQVSEATQSLTNLNELLSTVVHITPMLVGVKACMLYMLDEDGAFAPVAASGLGSEQRREFERWRFAPGDVPALDRLVSEKRAMILHDESEDPRLASILSAGMESDMQFESELLVLAPLAARGEVLGVILVDYSNDQPDGSSIEELLDERLAIIQGIAHQTATAVENIRLIKAQKEEAYVSVALLQVAQAVVSTNELDEILGAIVRITPILVGVKRALIYIWDDSLSVYRLAQAYGIPRNAGEQPVRPGEFPLLDAASSQDSLVAYPIKDVDTPAESIPDAWMKFEPPDLYEVDDYLQSEPCLLLANPLSVKGEVLGVMLVEEPDPLPVEGFDGGRSNRRMREKRLEITTGISQQAALAIQNDRLQREMVERERLEREMQLAREIQVTFLPHQSPEIEGWEVNVRWRTAREVGGDFYDFFELPDNRLGLVIADVADKGMPAALFMTLIRTLVRASVQEDSSPAEVLAHVNDVLVPDAQGGMFVTLVYAVLSVDTGELTYANAGHNPPLLLRARYGEIERLERGGMALGVLESSRVEARTVKLEPGDILILYTDGITETFSPGGEMYGEARLRQVAQSAAQPPAGSISALSILEAIDHSVEEFLGQGAPADDLTLVVIRRLPED